MEITYGSQKDYKYHWNKNKGYIIKKPEDQKMKKVTKSMKIYSKKMM